MTTKIKYLQFKQFSYSKPNVIIQRNHKRLPTIYKGISNASQWRLCDVIRAMANDHKVYFQAISPDGEFEVSF